MTDHPPFLGEQEVSVVLLAADGRGGTVPISATQPVDLESKEALRALQLADLLDAAVHLSTADGDPEDLIELILQTPVPSAFALNAWLYDHRVLVLRDGRCQLGAHTLVYERRLGLSLFPPPPTDG